MERQITLGDVIVPAKVLRCDNDDYPVLSMTMHDGIVLQSNRFKKSLASIDQSNYKVVLRGQLVVGFPIDEGVIYVQNIAEAGIMSPAYGVWNIHSKEIMPEYLELCLHSPQSMDYYKNKLRGTTARRRSITTGDLLALPIILPSLTEQKRRIGLFRQTTLLLNSQKQAMLKFDELVKSRFVEMFGDPVDNPMGWKMKPLMEMGYCKNGMNFHTGDSGIEVHCLGVGDFKDYSVIDGTEHLPTISLNEEPSEESMLRDGDIVFVRSNGNKDLVGRCVVVYSHDTPTTYSGFCIRYRLIGDEVRTSYLLRVLKADSMRKKMTGRGANIQNLNQQILASLNIPLPPIKFQEQFAAFISEVDKSKLAVKQSLEKLETLKKSLMQKYFG